MLRATMLRARTLRVCAALLMLGLAGCGGRATLPGEPATIECAPFARQRSGIQLYGDAASWWHEAEGRYERQVEPMQGGVLVFRRSGRLPSGHVSVVVRLVSDREIRVTQANWVHHRITSDEPVVDVSANNDWSQVRVWWAPVDGLGSSAYSTYGFIAPRAARPRSDLVAVLRNR